MRIKVVSYDRLAANRAILVVRVWHWWRPFWMEQSFFYAGDSCYCGNTKHDAWIDEQGRALRCVLDKRLTRLTHIYKLQERQMNALLGEGTL